jgi:hypothetical protein
MYANIWKYPNEWTESFESYLQHKDKLVAHINEYMTNYDEYAKLIPQQAQILNRDFFSATHLLEKLC